jgi:hypothetical protein
MALFDRRLIPPWIMFREIQNRGAATTKELKTHFGVDSSSIRQSLAPLLAVDAVWIVSRGSSVYYMVNTGQRGSPNPATVRKEARLGELKQCVNQLDFKQAMMKQIMVFNQVGWTWSDRPKPVEHVEPESNGKQVWSFDDDPEAVDLE